MHAGRGQAEGRERHAARDPDREAIQIARLRELAHDSGLDPAFAEEFLNLIIVHVIHSHESIRRDVAG